MKRTLTVVLVAVLLGLLIFGRRAAVAEDQGTAAAKAQTLQKLPQEVADLQRKVEELLTINAAFQANQKRITQENKALQEVIKKRDEMIVTLEQESRRYREEAILQQQMAKTLQVRLEALMKENRQLAFQAAAKEATILSTKKAPQVNPPTVNIRGVIEQIESKSGQQSLVVISVGSDHGLQKGHTLDVYRLQPKATYLGVIRIVEVQAQRSIAQIVGDPPVSARLQVGDQVASEIATATEKK